MSEIILKPGQILNGSLFNEPMRVETVQANGLNTWVVGLVGLQSERFRRVTLTARDLETLRVLESIPTYDGDGNLLRLGLQAYSLGIAYEFDPYFGLSISRVDPLPHQLEAIYDYLLKLARVRFLLADDAGAGKTIMSLHLNSGELRLIEVKGLGGPTGNVLLTPNEKRVAEDRRDCFWLYVVTDCKSTPLLQNPIKYPVRFEWHEVKKVEHYYLSVDAVTNPMEIREGPSSYDGREKKG